MSNYLGFEATKKPDYYFLSYNNEDAERIGQIAKQLVHANVPIWYDNGIDYGEQWESRISERILNAKAVLLFFTKGIFEKKQSYVYTEYTMATKYFEKKVYIILLDEIVNADIPYDKVPWWIDIQSKQCIDLANNHDYGMIANTILEAIGMQFHSDKMNHLIKAYQELYDNGNHGEAEQFLSEYLNGKTLEGKVRCIANLVSGKIEGFRLPSSANAVHGELDPPLVSCSGRVMNAFYECMQLTHNGYVFTFGNIDLHSRSTAGDVHRIEIWRNNETIKTIGVLFDVSDLHAFYDMLDDIIYVSFVSRFVNQIEYTAKYTVSVLTIEDPSGAAICNQFPHLVYL